MVQGEAGRQRALLARAALAEPEPALEAWNELAADAPLDDLWDPWCTEVLCRVAARLEGVPGVREGRRLAGVRRHLWARNQPDRRVLEAAVGAVVDMGVRPLGLRTPALWALGGRVSGGRRERGVDLQVDPADAVRAREALERLGWARVPGTGSGRLTTGLALASDDLRVWLYTGSGPGPGRSPVDFGGMRARSEGPDLIGCDALAPDDLVAWMLTEGALLGGLGSARWVVDLAGAVDGIDAATVEEAGERAIASLSGPPDDPVHRLAERSLATVRDLADGGAGVSTTLSGTVVEPVRSVELAHLPWAYLSVGATTGATRARLLAEAVAERGPMSSARWLGGATLRRVLGRTRARGGDPQITAPVR